MISTDMMLIRTIDNDDSDIILQGFNVRKELIYGNGGIKINGRFDWITDRIKFVCQVFLWPFENLLRGTNRTVDIVIGGYDGVAERLKDEIASPSNCSFFILNRTSHIKKTPNLRFFRYWVRYVAIGFASLLDFRKTSVRYSAECIDFFLKCLLIDSFINSYYIYYVVNPYNYLNALFIDRKCSKDLTVMMEYNYIFENRFLALNRGSLKLMSRFQNEEIEYYIREGTVRARNIIRFNETPYTIIDNSEDKIDIGFLSTGMWARTQDGIRHDNEIEIRKDIANNKFNDLWRIEKDYFITLCDYSRGNGWKIKLYLHPFERTIKDKYGIITPLKDCVDSETVFLDDSPDSDSHKCFSDFKVGIAIFSSAIWQRDSAGYTDNLLFDWNTVSKYPIFNRNAMGKYNNSIFSTKSELYEMLKSKLGSRRR